MAAFYRFSPHDRRIDWECHNALPNHPHVASYIAGALRANDGSVLVARLFCDTLNNINDPRVVSADRATAFARAQRYDEGLEKLFAHLRTVDERYLRRSMDFQRLLEDAVERENKIVPKKGQRPDKARFRPALAIKQCKKVQTLFTIIFNTAYAMLSDVPIELATEEAA